eukprot:gene25284-27377_t
MVFASILSAQYADKMAAAGTPDVIDREPVGTGPFQLVSYQKDAVIRYKAFDKSWQGRPKLDNLIYAITPDASVRYAKLKANEGQMMAYPKPADLAARQADKDLKVQTTPGLNVGYVAFNVEKKPFDNKLERQALNMAVDKQTILKTVFLGAGTVAKNLIPPTMWSYNDKVKDYAYDPAKAKELLAKAGYPNGVEIELWYLPVTRPYNPDGKRMAELIQADWEKIGVKTKLTTYEWGEYKKRSKTGEQSAMMFGWSGDNGDPDNFFATIFSCDAVKGGGNVARWCDKHFDALVQKAKIVSKQADRAALYEQAQVIAKEEAPIITIAHSVRFMPMRKEVIGYQMSATTTNYFDKVDLAKQDLAACTALTVIVQASISLQLAIPAVRTAASLMFGFLLRRLGLVIPTFLGITVMVFALIHMIPGNAVEVMSGEHGMEPARYAQLAHELGLDQPLYLQYFSYLKQVLSGNLGVSYVTHEP